MNAKISVLFYAKKSKTKSNFRVPIYLRITVNGKRAEFSTGKDVEISKWSSAQNRLKGNSEEARAINKYLDILKSNVLVLENKLALSRESFDAIDIKNLLTGANTTERYLIPIFEEHNSKIEKLLGKEYAPATLKNFKTCLAHLKEFLWKFHKKSDIDIQKLEPSFLNDFDFFLRTKPNINNNPVTLSNNVSMESVSKMLGHKSIKTTQHYAKILDKKVSEDMNNLKKILNQKEGIL